MGSKSEQGHGKNAANFEQLTAYCASLGEVYNPSNAALKLTALQTMLTSANNSLSTVNAAFTTNSNAIASRQTAFKPLSKLITRVGNSCKSCSTTAEIKGNAKSIIKKIQGSRVSKKLTAEELKELGVNGDQVKQISASQLSFDNRILNLDKLVKLLESTPGYAPNEADLKVTSLSALHTDLKTKNTSVVNSEDSWINSRIARDNLMYKDLTGLVDIAFEVKDYLKSLDGATGPSFKAISKLKFIKYKPKYSLS